MICSACSQFSHLRSLTSGLTRSIDGCLSALVTVRSETNTRCSLFSRGVFIAGLVIGSMSIASVQADQVTSYKDNQKAHAFIEGMVKEGFERQYLEQLMADAKRQDSIIKAISKPAEHRLTWGEYRNIFLGKKRVKQGVEFWNKYQDVLKKASQRFGVAPEIIVAIIGVETRYGRQAGSYRVLDALTTLSFDYPPRSEFFSGQLKELLYLVREEKLQMSDLKGSYAGAMGYGQFIPSSYRAYAVDFDGDGQRNILTNPIDAIGSVANYFKQHGWKSGEAVTFPAKLTNKVDDQKFNAQLKPISNLGDWYKLGVEPADAQLALASDLSATAMKMRIDEQDEYWLGLDNFYVITRYNHSRLYAMAVFQLSQTIAAERNRAPVSGLAKTVAVKTKAAKTQ